MKQAMPVPRVHMTDIINECFQPNVYFNDQKRPFLDGTPELCTCTYSKIDPMRLF